MIPENAGLRAELEARLRFETLIADLSSKFVNLPYDELDRQIEETQRSICELLDLDRSSLWQIPESEPGALLLTHIHRRGGGAPIPDGPFARDFFPWTAQRVLGGEKIVISKLTDLPPEADRDRESYRLYDTKSSLLFPLSVGRGPVFGLLTFAVTREERSWPEALVKRLRLIAQMFANAIARKRSDEDARELSGRLINAHEEERARLARELHDDVTQRLAIDAARVEGLVPDPTLGQSMRALGDGLVRLSEDIHALSYRLHPSVLEDLGLAEALQAECERFTRQESVPVEVKLREIPESVPRDAALCLFRVAQEALRNVARHANARTVEISARVLDGGLQLAVHDDGAGFDSALNHHRRTLGLTSMRERVHLLHGELDIESAPGEGTSVVVWVPLKRERS